MEKEVSGQSSDESSNESPNDERKNIIRSSKLGFDEIDNATAQQLIDAASSLSTKLGETKKDIKALKDNLNQKTTMRAAITSYITDIKKK